MAEEEALNSPKRDKGKEKVTSEEEELASQSSEIAKSSKLPFEKNKRAKSCSDYKMIEEEFEDQVRQDCLYDSPFTHLDSDDPIAFLGRSNSLHFAQLLGAYGERYQLPGSDSNASCGLSKRYELQRLISQGERSRVYRAIDTIMGDRTVAIKMLKKGKPYRSLIKREVAALKCLSTGNHPNIIQILEIEGEYAIHKVGGNLSSLDEKENQTEDHKFVVQKNEQPQEMVTIANHTDECSEKKLDDKHPSDASTSTSNKLIKLSSDKEDLKDEDGWVWIVMEWIEGGDLLNELKLRKSWDLSHDPKSRQFDYVQGLDESLVRVYFKQMAAAVEYCHTSKFCHRDIKLENFMLDWKTNTIKLIDFGTAIRIIPNKLFSQPCGTQAYLAPEVVLNKPYSQSVDVWGLGVCLYALLTGRFPFNYVGENLSQALRRITKQKLAFTSTLHHTISDQAKDLMSRMLTKNWKKRITIDQVLKHEWLNFSPIPSDSRHPRSSSSTSSQ